MTFTRLEDPQLHAVLELQQRLSAAGDERRLVREFARSLGAITRMRELIVVSVENVVDDGYRVASVLDLSRTGDFEALVEHPAFWGTPTVDDPILRGGLVGEAIASGEPTYARDLDPAADAVLAPFVAGVRDMIAIPLFHEGNVSEWVLLFNDPGSTVDRADLRLGVTMLNMLAREARQLQLSRRMSDLHAALDRQVHEVAEVQRSILPPRAPEAPSLEIAVRYRPSDLAGGDYYDFRTFLDGSIGCVVADVSGHGPAAAVVMAMMRTAMSIYRELDLPTSEIATGMNRFLRDGLGSGTFVTSLFVRIDPASGQLRYANAGHCPALLRRANGRIEHLDADGGPPLGVVPEIPTLGGEAALAPGDGLVLYTDGITEAFSPTRELFGVERLEDALRRADGTMESTLDRILDAVEQHEAGRPADDDRCLLGMRFIGAPGGG